MDDYDITHRVTWARRTASLLGAGTLGAVYGVAIGAVAAFLPFIFGQMGLQGASADAVLPGISTIASSAGLFAGVISVLGMAIGADVGANSASTTTALAAQDAKEKGVTVSEIQKQQDIQESKASGIYVPKAAAVLVPLFAAFGALIALNPATASMTAALGFPGATATTAASQAAVAASATVFGMCGGMMAFRNSLITNKLCNFYMKVFNGTVFDKAPEQAVAMAPEIQQEKAQNASLQEAPGPVQENPRVSFQAMLTERAERADTAQSLHLS